MTSIFRARHLLPITAPPIEDGAILVVDGCIRSVGHGRELCAAHPGVPVVDFAEQVILPPMANAHTHLELTDFPVWAAASRPPAGSGGFVDWVLALIAVRRKLSDDQLRLSLSNGLQQSLRAGTAVIGDILTSLDCRTAYAVTPLYGTAFVEALGRDPQMITSRLDGLDSLLSSPPGGNIFWGLSPHAPYTLSPLAFKQVVERAESARLPVAMHLAETAEEVEFIRAGSGPIATQLYPAANWPVTDDGRSVSPLRWLLAQGGLPAGSLLVHGVHVGVDEVESIAAAGLAVILCPRSNARFGAERAPLTAFRQAGIPLALGTDSLASSPSLSVWDELAFAWQWFDGLLSGAEWLTIATSGGATVLGRQDQFGSLASGRPANFQVVSLPEALSIRTVCAQLCAAADQVRVEALYLARDGRCENVLS